MSQIIAHRPPHPALSPSRWRGKEGKAFETIWLKLPILPSYAITS